MPGRLARVGLVSTLGAMLFLSGAACATGRTRVGVGVRYYEGPPPLRREVVVYRPGPGYVWVPGYWSGRPAHYAWVPGRWVRPPRPHAVWVAPRWERRGHSWFFVGGRWRL